TFVDVAAVVGLDLVQNHRSALWIDYDGDHDLDLIIGGDCRADPVVLDECDDPENLWLYRQSSLGTFEDVSETAGLNVAWGGTANWHRGGVSAGDINNDGYLDIFVIGWGDRAYLFRNNTDGSFSDVTLDTNITVDNYFYQQGVFHDFDRDGWTDLYVAVDGLVPNRLYRNEMNDTFTDIASAAKVDYASTDMGIAVGDIDNDGAIDIYVTEISQVLGDEFHHNQLYRNTTSGTSPDYAEVSQSLGVQNGFWGWGATFIDYDNDGWQDLATTNGKNKPGWSTDRSKFWRNSGISGRPFDDVSSHAGFDDSFIGAGLISFDFDRDGDLDLVQTTSEGGSLRVLRNDARPTSQTSRNYVVVRPRMSGTNHWAIGAVVTVEVGALKMTRVITAGTSTDSQEPAEAHFGLGDNPVVDRLVIDWPGGSRTSYVDLAANRVHDIVLQ
ncbi:MAG: CRTAC1 family protein, partial [Woeseiaceae bacterium]